MSKRCARCEKAVYPLEELKCLDKIWHKGCFKCQECGMTLSMKTYKGYSKLPYCEAHIPKAKATTVAETPEMRRLAENTKIQSNVQYHADFEKNKAKFTQVADDPETQRLKKNTQIISNVIYHGELAKKSEMERKRAEPNDEDEERSNWHDTYGGDIATAFASVHHTISPHVQNDDDNVHKYNQEMSAPPQSHHSHKYSHSPHSLHQVLPKPHHQHQSSTSNHSGRQPRSNNHPSTHGYNQNPIPAHGYHPSSNSHAPNAGPHYPPEYPQDSRYYPSTNSMGGQIVSNNHSSGMPANGSSGSYPSTNWHSASHSDYLTNNHYAMQQQSRRVGSIADYDPVNEQYGSISQPGTNPGGGYRQETTYQVQRSNLYGDQGLGQQQPPPAQMNNSTAAHHKVNAPPTQLGRCYRAMYDYEAADTDEVSFRDGDLIINCTAIDEGWMTGTIQRTGVTGMLPANYVERVS